MQRKTPVNPGNLLLFENYDQAHACAANAQRKRRNFMKPGLVGLNICE